MNKRQKKRTVVLLITIWIAGIFWACFLSGQPVYAAAEEQLTDQLELTDLQSMVDEMLGENSFSVTEAFHRLLSGEEVLSEESVREFLHSLLFSGLEKEKGLIVKLLLLLLFAAVFSGFAGAFDNGQIGEISFYVVYLLVFTLLMNSFSGLSASLLSMLRWITEFMKEMSPVSLWQWLPHPEHLQPLFFIKACFFWYGCFSGYWRVFCFLESVCIYFLSL